MKVSWGLSFFLLLAGFICSGMAVASEEATEGDEMRIVVQYGPGGGWDTYARLAARHMGKHLPGNPAIIVLNMPGAGGLVAFNHIYNRAKRDGLTVGMFETAVVFAQLAKAPGVRFDVRHFNWIGAFSTQISTCVAMADSPFKKLQDVIGSEQPMIVGSGGRVGGTAMEPLLLNRILGTNFRIIPGYRGTAAMRMAMVQGEVHGMCGWDWTSIKATGKELLANDRIRILIQFADQRHPEIPKNVPLVTEITPEGKRPLLEAYLIPRMIGKNLMLPPNVPQHQVQVLRDGFDKTMRDPEFLADAKRTGFEIDPLKGEEMTRMFERLFSVATPDVVAELKKIMGYEEK